MYYIISNFKFDTDTFKESLVKRKILFRDLEFNKDCSQFRMTEPKKMPVEDLINDDLCAARNFLLVLEMHDDIQKNGYFRELPPPVFTPANKQVKRRQ